MIIRRIAENLNTGRFSTLAVELIVVIVGVFIGIQASNWNEARLDRARAYSYLERIRSDLDADITNFENGLRFWSEVSAFGELGLAHATSSNQKKVSDWDLLLAYFQASQLQDFVTTRNTYDELKSGGELGLIRDLELRARLASFYIRADNSVLSERPSYREHVRGLIPLHIQTHIWKNCYAIVGDTQALKKCDSPADQDSLAAIVNMISGDTVLISELRYWMSTMQVASIMAEDRAKVARELRNLVDEQID